MDVRPAITIYKKSQKLAYCLLIGLALGLALQTSLVDTAIEKFHPVSRNDLMKIIRMNHSNPKLISAIIQTESEWRSNAVSHKGAIGLMQVMPESSKWLVGYSRKDLFCPEKNIIAGTKILKYYQRTSPNLRVALNKYSGGADRYYEKVMRNM